MARQYNFQQKPGESLEAYYHRIAKVADQRLVRLEKLAITEEGYGNATQWAYQRAMRDIESWSGEAAVRFNMKAPSNTNQLKAKINDIKAFLGSESSTKSGIKGVYQQRVNSLNKHYGTQFQTDDLKKLFDSSLWKKLEGKISSDTIIKAIAYIKDNTNDGDEDLVKGLQAQARKRKEVPTFTGDPMVDEVIGDMLRSKKTVNEMYQFFKSV